MKEVTQTSTAEKSNNSSTSETLHFDVDSHLLLELGERLVSKPSVALAELVKNSYDADAPSVTIEFRNIGKKGGTIIVEDTGEGIPEADQAFVFERFWRGDRARTRSSLTGSGLGLPISKQIVEAHGGRIAFTSKPGQGTRFFIYLENPFPAEPSGRRG